MLIALLTVGLLPFRDDLTTATTALCLLVPGLVAAVIGGRLAAGLVATAAAVALNLVFLEPYGTLKVAVIDDIVALVIFTGVALAVATLVALEADRRRAAIQRAAEVEALWMANEEMRVEQDRLAAEKQALAIVDNQRAALLRSVSHDLRTPLATIRAVMSDLREGTDYDPATRTELLDLVADEAERLDRLVQNLLSLSRIEAGSLEPDRQAVPIDELLVDRVHRMSRLLSKVRVSLDLGFALPLVDADYTMIDQVVTNLLENAVRHAPADSLVQVSARTEGGVVEVAVSDEGPGIDPADAERLFQPFARGPGSSSSGVGLAICSAFVEAHGGSIFVGSGPSGGAQVAFRLPVRDG